MTSIDSSANFEFLGRLQCTFSLPINFIQEYVKFSGKQKLSNDIR